MDTRHLRYFSAVSEHKSISRAAADLGINQSALSRQIHCLEKELGVCLFYRNGRGVVLTEPGARLLAHAHRALEEVELAKQSVIDLGKSKEIRIGWTPSIGKILVQPIAAQLASRFPAMKPRFVEGFSSDLIEWLNSGRLDLAVIYKNVGLGNLSAERLISEKLFLVASPEKRNLGQRFLVRKLENVSLVLPSPQHGLRRAINALADEQKLSLNICMEADSLELILALVKGRKVYSILPKIAFQHELAFHQVKASLLVEPEIVRTLICVTPRNRPPVKEFDQVARIIKAQLEKYQP